MISRILKRICAIELAAAWICPFASGDLSCPDGARILDRVFLGLKHTRPQVVERELELPVGGFYSDSLWQQEKRNLQDLDLFADIELSCAADSQGGVKLQYRFLEIFQYLPAPSVKQSDQDGWMLGGALAALNLFGYDIRTEVQARATVEPWLRAKEYAFYANSPWMGPYPFSWRAELVQTDTWDPLRNFKDRSLNGEIELWQMESRHWGTLFATGFRSLSHTGSAEDSLDWLSSSNRDWVPRFGGAFLWDTRDAALDTRKGLYSEMRVTQNAGWLGGVGDYIEVLWDFRGTLPLGPGYARWGWLARVRPGTIGFYDRLYQGGANSLRGYNPDSAIDGNSEVLANAEWRQVLVDRRPIRLLGVQGYWGLQWVLGYDAAWLWMGNSLPDWENYRGAIYTGLHLVVPAIDRVRMEIGGNPHDHTWAFTIGLYEKAVTQRWRSR